LAIAAVCTCDLDLRWTTINRGDRFCRARRKAVNDEAMAGRTVFAALVSTSHSWALAASYQILPMDALCFREWGRIMDRKPDRLLEDAMIAATARVHQLIVATRNEADFRQLDVQILNPFKTS
jgi:predicted nucleic acid-binding protein